MTVVDNGPDLTTLAATDRRVARDLSAAERDRVVATQRIAAADAAAERRLREAEGRLDLEGKRDQVKADRRERRAAQREADRRTKRATRATRRAARKAQAAGLVSYVRDNAASVYSSAIYGLAVAGAIYGQIDAARLHQIPTLTAVVVAIAIEGTGLAMALTAQQQRLSRERAMAARSLVWICTALAVAINYIGHAESNPAKAYVLSALSALGIVVFEIRSGAKHRKTLRELGMIAQPGEQFGMARWLAFPGETFAAWKLGVRDRLSPGAAALISRVELAAADRRRRARVGEVAKLARKAARKAARKGEAGPALAALVRLSHTGTPAPLLALPSPARAEADAARLALAEAQAQLRLEVEARENAETAADEAVMEAALLRQETEVEVARVRREAEVEVADARRRVEVEVARRTEAESRVEVATANFHSEAQRRVEAERLAASTQERAEVEARRAAQMRGQAEAAGRGSETVQRQLAGEQQARVQAETRAATAEQVLAAEQQRIARLERQHEQAAQSTQQQLTDALAQAADLRVQLAEVQAGSRRTRRSTPAAPAEPVLFHGRPVPVVPGAGPETVLKVLQAHEADPTAIQQVLAVQVGTSKRTVGAVLKAASEQVSD